MSFKSLIVQIYFLLITIGRSIKNSLLLRFKRNLKLHIGSGNLRIKNYLNIDALPLSNVDLAANIRYLKWFIKPNSVSHIYACHVLEHFSHEKTKQVLALFYELLCKNGELRISVPDMDKIVKIYHKNWRHFQTPGHSPWIGLIWGGQFDKYDFHKTGFNFCWLKHLLIESGFRNIKEYNPETFLGKNIKDASLAKEPFGKPISLNIVAKKK